MTWPLGGASAPPRGQGRWPPTRTRRQGWFGGSPWWSNPGIYPVLDREYTHLFGNDKPPSGALSSQSRGSRRRWLAFPQKMGIYPAMELEIPCACITLRRAARAVTAAYDAALAPSGLRVTQFSVLRKLARLGPLPVTRLATGAALDRSTMGRNLNPLERRGLVRIEGGKVTSASASPISRPRARPRSRRHCRTGARLRSGSRPWCNLPPSANSPTSSTPWGRMSRFHARKEQDGQKMPIGIPDIQRDPSLA